MREKLYEAKVTITGTHKMLYHKMNLTPKKGTVTNQETSYDGEWKRTIYNNSDNELFIPSLIIKAALLASSKGQRIGKNFLVKMVPTGVRVNPFEIPVMVQNGNGFEPLTVKLIEENDWVFTCPVRMGKGKAITRQRAYAPAGWTASFIMEVYNTLITKDILYHLLDRAGYDCGLMDWRPGTGGDFGQFEISKFEVTKS